MADILGKYTQMSVLQAEDGMAVEENTVYLIPPKKNITYHSGRLFLRDYVQGALTHPIDIFLNSLAEEKKEHAIAVILSGTGSDGTGGVKTTKERGGLTIVQEPATAKFDGMPKSAIATGVVDYVLSPKDIADELLHYAQHHAIVEPEDDALFTDEESFSHIYAVLKKVRGIDFTHYKRTTVLRRIERRMVVTHSMSLAEYARVLDNSPDEVNVLVKEILIGVTNFFRDPAFFEKLKEKALYPIVQNAREDEPIRVWSAGCSTGEEAYSIAILFAEILEELHLKRDIKIFATDIDVQAIEQAGKGVFAESIIEDVSPERLARFFIKRNDQYAISKSIRRMIIFAPHNMLSDPPFGKLDLISCRNVMIYFQPVLQRSLSAIFHSALKNGGYLFLGKKRDGQRVFGCIQARLQRGEDLYPQRHRQDGQSRRADVQYPQHTAHAAARRQPAKHGEPGLWHGNALYALPGKVHARIFGTQLGQQRHPLLRQLHGLCGHRSGQGVVQPLFPSSTRS